MVLGNMRPREKDQVPRRGGKAARRRVRLNAVGIGSACLLILHPEVVVEEVPTRSFLPFRPGGSLSLACAEKGSHYYGVGWRCKQVLDIYGRVTDCDLTQTSSCLFREAFFVLEGSRCLS